MRDDTIAVREELKCGTLQLRFSVKSGAEYCLIGDDIYLRYLINFLSKIIMI